MYVDVTRTIVSKHPDGTVTEEEEALDKLLLAKVCVCLVWQAGQAAAAGGASVCLSRVSLAWAVFRHAD